MTIKMSWGKRIAILYLGFVAIIVTLVVGSMRQDFDLVSKDYYEQEIAYQNTIDAGRNQAALSAPVTVDVSEGEIKLDFPAEFREAAMNADLHFYSPVRAALDKKISRPVNSGSVVVSRKELAPTNYRLKINWEHEGKKYYQETEVKLIK
jgi:nitrogen fixation protein FixH